MEIINRHRKTLTALATGLLGWGAAVVASSPSAVTASEWITFGTVLATALGVYGIQNK
jgi:hypothetical protein